MYRTNHFNSCNFPVCDFCDAQGAVRKIDARPDPRVCFVLLQLFQDDVPQRLVLLIRQIEMEETVDAAYFLAGTEENLIGFVKGHEQEFAGGKQDGDGDHADQAVDRRGVVNDDLPGFKHF